MKLCKIKNAKPLCNILLAWCTIPLQFITERKEDPRQKLFLLCVTWGQYTTYHGWSIGYKLLTQTLKLSLKLSRVLSRPTRHNWVWTTAGRAQNWTDEEVWQNPSFPYTANLHLYTQSHLQSIICLMMSLVSVTSSVCFYYSEEPKAHRERWNAFRLKALVRLKMYGKGSLCLQSEILTTSTVAINSDIRFRTELLFSCEHIPLPSKKV